MDELNQSFANLTFPSEPPPSFPWGFKTLFPVSLMSLCFVVGFPGNVAVLILRPNWQKLSKLTQSLMMNLAFSDLLCLVTLPVWIYAVMYDWTLGIVTCKIGTFLVYCSIYSSLLTVTALSVQRYMQVVHPLKRLQFKKRLLVLLWLMSMVLSIQVVVARQIIIEEHNIVCFIHYRSRQHVAILLTECIVGFSSFITISCAYILLNRKLNQTVFFNNGSTLKFVTIIILTFLVMWLPYMFFNLVIVGGILNNNQNIAEFYEDGYDIFAGLTFINSGINPLLYAFAGGRCRKNANIQQDTVSEL